MEARRPGSAYLLAAPYLVAILGVAALALGDAWNAPTARLVDSFDDDAYYYFEVARHVVSGQGSSFDGLTSTNGYHPLWLLCLLPVFAVVTGKLTSLLAVKALGVLLFAISVLALYRCARRLGRELEIACAVPILIFCRDLWLSGMETALLLPLLLLAGTRLIEEGVFTRNDARLGPSAAFLAAALLARLDLVFFVALVALAAGFLVPALHFRDRILRSLRLGGPAALALVGYMGVSQLLFGTASPVSGQAKSLGGPFWNSRVFSDYLQAKPVLGPLFELLPVAALLLLIVLPAFLLSLLARRRGEGGEALAGATPLLAILVLANACQLLYYAVFSSWPLWRWYYYYLPIALVLAISLLAAFVWSALPAKMKPIAAIALPLLLSAGIAAKLGSAFLYLQKKNPAPTANYKIQAWAAAEKLNAELPPDAILAMGDRAGAFGYFLDRPLVQVEGLVASKAFLEALEEGQAHLFLQRLGVDYVVYSGGEKSGGQPAPLPNQEGCATFTEPKWGAGPKYQTAVCPGDLIYEQKLDHPGAMGGTTSVWRYRPQRD